MPDYAKFLELAEDFKNKFKKCACEGEELLASSWKKAFLIILLGDNIDTEIDREKALKLALVQNLAECIPYEDLDCAEEKAKRKALKAFVRENVEDDTVYQLYKELHKNETLEAQFVNSLGQNTEDTSLFWMKEEDDDEQEETEDEEDPNDECEEDNEYEEKCCECGCEEEKKDNQDIGLVYEYLNKIADVLKIDFRKRDKKDKDKKHKHEKHKHEDEDYKDKKHKDKHKHKHRD